MISFTEQCFNSKLNSSASSLHPCRWDQIKVAPNYAPRSENNFYTICRQHLTVFPGHLSCTHSRNYKALSVTATSKPLCEMRKWCGIILAIQHTATLEAARRWCLREVVMQEACSFMECGFWLHWLAAQIDFSW